MKKRILADMTTDELVEEFVAIGLAQYDALWIFKTGKYNKLYFRMQELEDELKRRSGDQRSALMQLYTHKNVQVRLAAAHATLALAYEDARRVIQAIADSNEFPQAGDAGMSLWNLDRGVYKPT